MATPDCTINGSKYGQAFKLWSK